MASTKIVSKLLSRLQPLVFKINRNPLSPELIALKSTSPSQVSAYARRVSRLSRLPVELGCVGSMMPLHSAIASTRLISSLSSESESWALVPQGISMPL